MVVQFSNETDERAKTRESSQLSYDQISQTDLQSYLTGVRPQNRQSRAVRFAAGFMEGVNETIGAPLTTIYKSGTSLLCSTAMFTTLDLALSRLGPAGKVASLGLAVVPSLIALGRAAVLESPESLGHSAFDLSLAWGLGKTGSVISPFHPKISPLAGTRGLPERAQSMLPAQKASLSERFELPATGVLLGKLNKTGLTERDGKSYFVYHSPDFQSKLLLDAKVAHSIERTPSPYRGVDYGTYPLRALQEGFYMPNRNTVSEMRFNHAPDGKSAAVVPGATSTIIVNGHRMRAERIFRHEYTHCVSNCNTDLRPAYTLADRMDHGKRITAYAGKNVEESLAETMGLGLLSHSGQTFVEIVHTNPLRSFVANRYLARELNAVSGEAKSVYHDHYLSRSRYIDETAPKLLTPILEQAASRPGLERHAVRRLLNHLKDTDPVASKLLTSPTLESSLGGRLTQTFDKLHTPSDLKALTFSAFLLRPAIDSIAQPTGKQSLK